MEVCCTEIGNCYCCLYYQQDGVQSSMLELGHAAPGVLSHKMLMPFTQLEAETEMEEKGK